MKQNIWSIWKVGAVLIIGSIVLCLNTSSLSIIGSMWFIIGWDPMSAYHLSEEIELHVAETYAEYLTRFPKDVKIWEIMNDEIHHWQELREARKDYSS